MARAELPPSVRQRCLGELFGATQSRISNIEAGGYAVSAERVRALARLYECADGELIDCSEEAHLTVSVIPFGMGTFPGAGHGIVQFGGPLPRLDTVQLDTDHGSVFVDGEAQLAKYRTVLDRMEACALGPPKSRDLILHVMRSL
ncbi:Scr1 family TA system antitoxin-like transcriptional regulator [Streptomyces brevispora]|uniref:Scr1 family TA system antitoxin-like transcriptional regulator n=1 Tax=Streptomyces brevispora TaxID=887462 RepID=UPI0035DD0C82